MKKLQLRLKLHNIYNILLNYEKNISIEESKKLMDLNYNLKKILEDYVYSIGLSKDNSYTIAYLYSISTDVISLKIFCLTFLDMMERN